MSLRTSCLALLLLLSAACAGNSPITAWKYSSWSPRYGVGEMGDFDKARQACLEQVGAAADPAAVAPGSQQETDFVMCMNAAHWCTNRWGCDKPGAS